ncbi:MAG TPA: hydrolase [Gemmatimonadaceae bacterium]|nr:hydrolase [Gemmatimonadaceae bacterium]
MTATSTFRAPWFARNPHVQTLWGKFIGPEVPLDARRETWQTPDGDDVTVLRAHAARADAPRFVLFHGLEGTERSHYVSSLFRAAVARGWAADMMLWRSCGGVNNRAARFYHSGETGDAGWFLHRLAETYPEAPIVACGVSLGGNVLTKLVGDPTHVLPPTLVAAAAVSVPFDLERGSRHIGTGVSRMYEKWFLRSLRVKALEKASRYPELFPQPQVIARIRTLWEFDDLITGPLHGFAGASDYYTRSSAIHFVQAARVPLLLLSAADDPFLPRDVLDEVRLRARSNALVHTEFVPHGGHVGFIIGDSLTRTRSYLAERVPGFFAQHLPLAARFSGSTAVPDPSA